MNWTLRSATLADLDTLLPMVRSYHAFEHIEQTDAGRSAAITELLSDPNLGGIWLLSNGDVVCGYIVLCIGYSLEFAGHDAFVDEFFIQADWRGKGGGKFALEFLKREAKQRNIRALHLEVARDNLNARRLYERVGMEARERYVLMSTML